MGSCCGSWNETSGSVMIATGFLEMSANIPSENGYRNGVYTRLKHKGHTS